MPSPINLGIAGLGMAGAVMVHAAAAHPGIRIAGAADPNPAPRDAFTRDTGAPAQADIAALCTDPAIEAIYIATPHQCHAPHAIMAAQAGKHLIIEKPLALTMDAAAAIVAAVHAAGVHCIVGHTHAFDPQIRLMRDLITSGAHGRLAMLALWNYTNFLYRPRRPEELDTARGGGIVFNQLPHQIDIVRLLGGEVRSVRATLQSLDPARPTEDMATALLQLANGAAASLVYSGTDHFDADELHHWIAESGADKPPNQHGAARRALAAREQPESDLRTANFAYGAAPFIRRPHQPHFGLLIASCAGADLRPSPDGVTIYTQAGREEIAIPRRPGVPGRHEVLDDLVAALRRDQAPLQNAAWGLTTLQVALALLQSSRERREIVL